MVGDSSDWALRLAHLAINSDRMWVISTPRSIGFGFDPLSKSPSLFGFSLLHPDLIKIKFRVIFGVLARGNHGFLPFDALWG